MVAVTSNFYSAYPTSTATTASATATAAKATSTVTSTTTASAGAATSVTLSFFDTNIIYDYNDFVIDDINFTAIRSSAVPEPASWAMMIGGFALAGGVLRHRRAALRFA